MIEKHRRKKHPRRHPHFVWADPEQFHVERMTAGLTQKQAAEYLGVSVRSIRNWESGCNRVPYPAFKLVRMRARALVHVEVSVSQPGGDDLRPGTTIYPKIQTAIMKIANPYQQATYIANTSFLHHGVQWRCIALAHNIRFEYFI